MLQAWIAFSTVISIPFDACTLSALAPLKELLLLKCSWPAALLTCKQHAIRASTQGQHCFLKLHTNPQASLTYRCSRETILNTRICTERSSNGW